MKGEGAGPLESSGGGPRANSGTGLKEDGKHLKAGAKEATGNSRKGPNESSQKDPNERSGIPRRENSGIAPKETSGRDRMTRLPLYRVTGAGADTVGGTSAGDRK